MLTVDMLKQMPPHHVFAHGTVPDNHLGINMSGSSQQLRWVAVRGGIEDWAIYIHFDSYNIDMVKRQGDKVYNLEYVKRLVACNEESLSLYRR